MEKTQNVLDFYYQNVCGLKERVRTGWKHWNVSGDRLESIPEHVWGTQILAQAMWSEFDFDVNIDRVILMLSLHETDEVYGPDFTPFDTEISEIQRQEIAKKSVDKVCSKMQRAQFFKNVINEFNERKTKEAKFAYWCDKLECDLQANLYSAKGRVIYEDSTNKIKESQKIKQILLKGAISVGEIFIEYDKEKFKDSPEFIEVLNFLKSYYIK